MSKGSAGVFNRFWSTMGGGEQLAAAYALALASDFDVELISTAPVDIELVARRLGQPELSRLKVRLIGDSPTAATEVSADYDLFLNHSFTSEDVNLSSLGIYVCMFPQIFRKPTADDLRGRFTCIADTNALVSPFGDSIELTNGTALDFSASHPETLTFIAQDSTGFIELVDEENTVITTSELGRNRREFVKLQLPAGLSSMSFRGNRDVLNILSPRLGDGMRIFIEGGVLSSVGAPSFVSSYDKVLSISQFTDTYVQRRWGINGVVHYPPVNLRPVAMAKERVILSVGRFFSEDVGHCKQQLRMVHAFRRMVDDGLTGWSLSLVGGCDKEYRDYALAVRQAAKGYPINVYLNADLEKLNEEFQRAAIYWHATGLNTDIVEHPDRAEHFGIAPIEAMSTGAIPIVFDFGGPKEIVEPGLSGRVFSDVNSLIQETLSIVRMSARDRTSMGHEAIRRSQEFSIERYRGAFAQILQS